VVVVVKEEGPASPGVGTGRTPRRGVRVRAPTRATALSGVEREGGHVEGMQRRRLLLAMSEVLAEHGYEDASIGRVCKRAGVSRRTFYEIFHDRDECLLVTFDAAVERLAEPVLAVWEGDGSWRERTRGALGALLEQLDAEPAAARVCVVETLKGGTSVMERRARVLGVLVGAVEQGRDEAKPGSEPPPLAGQGVVGGVLSVLHARLIEAPLSDGSRAPFSDLASALMAMIVQPYLGGAAARRELERPLPKAAGTNSNGIVKDPFKDLSIRFTYRTARVLATIATNAGASNRSIADTSGVSDDGQMSRLLTRLERAGLIENNGQGRTKGEANAWTLTDRGRAIQTTLAGG
jgi:AcrR family transcriptional regulator/DNA-binding MarR family transcriptional regulator